MKVGDRAPTFALKNQNNELISLDSYTGKWVLIYFYPKALTPGCTVQACALRDAKSERADLGVEILGLSPDTPALLKKFEANDALNFTLLSDADHQVAESYGTWVEKSMYGRTYMGMERSSFLVDGQGVIRAIWRKVDPKTHWEAVKTWLKANAQAA